MKKRIGLFLESSPNWGGTFQYNLAILEAVALLPKEEFEVVVAYIDPIWVDYLKTLPVESFKFNDYISFPILDRICSRIKPISEMPERLLNKIRWSFIKNSLRTKRCKLWIFPSQDSWSYKLNSYPLTTIHDLMHRYESHFPEVSANGEYEARELKYKNICKHSKGILVDSEVGKKHVFESYGFPLENIYVLPYIPPKYVYENNTSEKFDEKYKVPQKFIFYPAQFWEHKNHLNLVKAVSALKKEIPDINIVLVGHKNNAYEQVFQEVQKLNLNENVNFLGYVPNEDFPELYRRARALVMPTFFGPTNIPQLEAFVLGCPVATSNIYGIPEQVGNAALLFDPKSVDEIAACISRLWMDDNLCEELAERGKQRALEWGPEQFNKQVLEIVKQAIINC